MRAAFPIHSPCLDMQIQSHAAKEGSPEEIDARIPQVHG
uniref:Uncharacterized protein n=1 Tax=Arundo donax TaxID=35708 RepID=A0A0A9BG20_ARUDO